MNFTPTINFVSLFTPSPVNKLLSLSWSPVPEPVSLSLFNTGCETHTATKHALPIDGGWQNLTLSPCQIFRGGGKFFQK